MRIWFKIYTDTHLMRDITIENNSDDTRTHKIFKALEDACLAFDLGKPIWLDSNISDFKRHGKTRFTKDNFVEDIDFDFLEMHKKGKGKQCILHNKVECPVFFM